MCMVLYYLYLLLPVRRKDTQRYIYIYRCLCLQRHMGCIHVMMYVCMHAVLIYTHRSHRFVHIDIYARSLRHVWSELVFVHTSFQIHVSGDERNSNAVGSKHVGSCTIISVANSNQRILYSHLWWHPSCEWLFEDHSRRRCYAKALLTSQLEHPRNWNYQFS